MLKKTSSNQPCGRDSEYISGAFLKSFSIVQTFYKKNSHWTLKSLYFRHENVRLSNIFHFQSVVFKTNPYFWGDWADRITSYVPTFTLEGAILTGETVTYKLENSVVPDCMYVLYVLCSLNHQKCNISILSPPYLSMYFFCFFILFYLF